MRSEYVDYCKAGGIYHCTPARDGTLYVACERDAMLEAYDPLEAMPEIILFLLQIGIAYDGGEEIGGRVTEFCHRYGQLGFRRALVEKEDDNGTVKFYAGNVLGRKAATRRECEAIFEPFRARQDRPRLGGALDYFNCEAVNWYGRYGQQLCGLLRDFQAGEPLTLLPGNIELRYETVSGVGRRHVYFDSLKSACDFYVMEMTTRQPPAVRLCKRCGKPLLTRGRRTEYCSASCRNVMNVANSRRRKRDKPQPD